MNPLTKRERGLWNAHFHIFKCSRHLTMTYVSGIPHTWYPMGTTHYDRCSLHTLSPRDKQHAITGCKLYSIMHSFQTSFKLFLGKKLDPRYIIGWISHDHNKLTFVLNLTIKLYKWNFLDSFEFCFLSHFHFGNWDNFSGRRFCFFLILIRKFHYAA